MVTKVLESPDQSANDLKEYRVIQLDNGVRALLIADTRYDLEKLAEEEKLDCRDDEDDDEEDLDEEESEEDESEDEEEDDEEQDPGGKKKRKKTETSSGLKKSAAGLCVHMGSFSDPQDIPGLAHFLEHMVFMGSEKYPDENSFDNFIQKNGGYDNASTDCETTNFYFETQRKSFREGLNRFAQFFINPLMKKGAMQREREAVDSEFEMALPADYNRKQQLFGSLAKEGHPMAKFMWGNLKSLVPEGLSDDEIHQRLHEFKNRHYTAQSMSLVVQSQDTLDNLQEWVEESFNAVPNNGKDRESFRSVPLPFDTEKFHKIYKVSPVQNTYQVDLSWALPPLHEHYRVKPLHYLSWIIGHEGKGSLISYLRKKIWALSLTAGNCGDGFEYNETYSLFCITIVLTKQGFENRDKVLEAVFSYINMMKSQGPSERIYREIQKIEDLDFKFREERQPSDNVENLCENMLFYPPKLYLTGDDLMFDYDEKLIRDCTEMLKADKVNIFMMAREFLDECNETEPWFATEYKTEDIPEQSRQAWADAVPLPDMHLPEKNSFIAEDTSFKPIADGNPKYPVRIVDEPHGELFHRQDDIFKQPLAYIKFYLTSSASLQDVRSAVCLELFSGCISQTMVEETYPADLAQLSFFLSSAERGLLLKLSGLNDKLHFLLGVILDNVGKFEDLCTDEMFAAVRDQIKKNYYNHFIKPMKLVRDVRMSVIQDVYFQVTDKHAVVGDISKEEVVAFMKRFMAAAYLQGSVQGNMTREESKACYELFKSKLPFNPIQGEKPELRCKILPAGEKITRVNSLNPLDGNTVVTNYYQFGPGDLKSYTKLELTETILSEPLFDELRTKEQLGYSVFSMVRNTFGIIGLSVTVCTQASKFDADHVDLRIKKFFEWFLNEKLSKMSPEEFQEEVHTLIKQKKAADVTLDEEAARNWSEIVSREYLFDRHEKDIVILETLDGRKAVMDIAKQLTDEQAPSWKKLSVQIVGNKNGGESKDSGEEVSEGDMDCSADPDGKFGYDYAKIDEGDKREFITNVKEFCQSMECYPVVRIIK